MAEDLIEEAEALSIVDIRRNPLYAAELVARLSEGLREALGLESDVSSTGGDS